MNTTHATDRDLPRKPLSIHTLAAAQDMREMLGYCEAWFAKYSPTADLLGTPVEHPMLTSIRAVIAKANGRAK